MEGFLRYWFRGLFLEFYGNDLLRPLNILIKYQKQKVLFDSLHSLKHKTTQFVVKP